MVYSPRNVKHKIADFFQPFLGYGHLAKTDNFLPGLGDVLWANTPQNISQIRHDFIDIMIQKGIKPDEIESLHFILHGYGVTLGFDFVGLASQLPMSIKRNPNLLKTLSFGKNQLR